MPTWAMLSAAWAKAAAAVDELRAFMAKQPDNPKVLTWLAWVLATAPDDAVRNGREALDLAQRRGELAGASDPAFLDTLAAAYAEAGSFSEAAKTASQAVDLAQRRRQPELAETIRPEFGFTKRASHFATTRRPSLITTRNK